MHVMQRISTLARILLTDIDVRVRPLPNIL
jgi:hypothetical protein